MPITGCNPFGSRTFRRESDGIGSLTLSLKSGEDFLDPGQEMPIGPPDHYLANPRSTVVLLGK